MASRFQRFTGTAVSSALVAVSAFVPASSVLARDDEKYEISCEARGWGEQFCAAPNRKIKLVDDYSGHCDKGETWRSDERGIYVRNGCAARFRVTRDGYAGNGYGTPDDGYYDRKKDNTGAIVGAVAIGAGLLWLISQSSKNKKKSDDKRGGDWVDPDSGGPRADDSSSRYSPAEQDALDACDARVKQDVSSKGGKNARLTNEPIVAPGGQTDVIYVTANYAADFNAKKVIRKVQCTVKDGRVTDYKLA